MDGPAVDALVRDHRAGRRHFHGLDLAEQDLTGVDLTAADLSGSCLRAARLGHACLAEIGRAHV